MDDLHISELERRHAALAAFLHNPEEAAIDFQEQLGDLCSFLLLSTNPYSHALNAALAKDGNELEFDEWEHARNWIVVQMAKAASHGKPFLP
jgi:hypothetical protein